MKKTLETALYIILAITAASCAKAVKTGPNEANRRYLEAWMDINHKGIEPTGLGIYVLEETSGNGIEVQKDGFVYADYIVTDLEGNISSYTGAETAKQLGTYDETAYYGPYFLKTIDNTVQAGLADALIGMKVGGRKKVVIPGWLMTYAVYGTAQEYFDNSSTGSNTIYEVKVKDFTTDITKFEADSVDRYISSHKEGEGEIAKGFIFNNKKVQPLKDTAYFFQPLSEKRDPAKTDPMEKIFKSDTTIYINYTGKLLNGLIFDTTIEKVAKDNGIYSPSRTYGPTEVTWADKYTEIKLGDSSVIQGFSLTLWMMQNYTKGVGIFYSPLGYTNSGSGVSIPPYSPLIFEIEVIVEEEAEE